MTLPRQVHLRCACALAVALTLVCAPRAVARGATHAHAKSPVQSIYATRALLAYQAMQQNFYVPGTGLYRGEPEYSFLWPFSQALAATVTLSYMPATRPKLAGTLRALLVGLRQYLGPPPPPAVAPSEAGAPAYGRATAQGIGST